MPRTNSSRSLPCHACVELALDVVHRDGGLHGAVGVVVLRERRAEHRHHGVADELHHGALGAEDRAGSSRPGAR